MNRTDRLYALVEELRAVTPAPRSARWLAGRFEVSARTVERDIGALQQAGVPIYAEPGRTGGYVLDRTHTLPPVNVTAGEAVAIAVALEGLRGTPFEEAARAALRKVVAVMPARDAVAAGELAGRVRLLGAPGADRVPTPVARALSDRRVLRFGYVDRHGAGDRAVGVCRGRALVPDRLVPAAGFGALLPAGPDRRSGRHRGAGQPA